MLRASAKSKGKEHEDFTGKALGAWWCGQQFYRAHGSGSHSARRQGHVQDAGDLYVPDDFPWSVECKKQENWYLDEIMTGKGLIMDWTDQSVFDARHCGRLAMLSFTRNRHPKYLGFEIPSADNVQSLSPAWLPEFYNKALRTLTSVIITNVETKRFGRIRLLVCILEEFLRVFRPDEFRDSPDQIR